MVIDPPHGNSLLDAAAPSFGEADLSNCEREQIHLPGSIQPIGALLVLDPVEQTIEHMSRNAAEFLGVAALDQGLKVDAIPGTLAARILEHLDGPLEEFPACFNCRVGDPARPFDVVLHRGDNDCLFVELLRADSTPGLPGKVREVVKAISAAESLKGLCDEVAEQLFGLAGYDRVMVYRFDPDGHGHVFSEKFEKKLEPYLGIRYPASDIPQIARRLYIRNRVRVLADVDYEPVALEPRTSPASGEDIDMSMCFLRSMSPIHLQYLRNMGVTATLVVSLVVGGKLWGLIACHHYSPKMLPYDLCIACELLAEAISTRVAAFGAHELAQADWRVRQVESHLVEQMARSGDWKAALFGGSQHLLKPLDASGAALLIDGEIFTTGDVPGTHKLREIAQWLGAKADTPLFHTAAFGAEAPEFAALKEIASGILAVPVSKTPGEYLLWFRRERPRTEVWGGNPAKAVEMGDDPADLSPRRSFAKWYEQVEGTSQAWTPATRSVATRIGRTVSDTVLHFRSVRSLIARDELNKVMRQVARSEQPVVIADASRRVVLVNESMQRLLPPGQPHLGWLEDLPQLFIDPADFRRNLAGLCDRQQAWRGKLRLKRRSGETLTLLLRGDPVIVPPERILGYVLVFTDLTEVEAVDAARRRVQESIVSERRGLAARLDADDGVLENQLFSPILGNAQLAAMEIADGADVDQVPFLLESVGLSVGRSAELLKHFLRFRGEAGD